MKRNCNENSTAMEVPLPTCFATLRKGVDGNNANDGYDKMGVVPGRKNRSPDSIQYFEHHIRLFSRPEVNLNTSFVTELYKDDCEVYVIVVHDVLRKFSILPMQPKGGAYHPRYSVYLHVNPHPSFLLVGEFWDHLPAGS